MPIRSVFARNLRMLCKERGLSINAACKGIGIARSQMDRYLAGANLPNDRNLARISTFFGIDDRLLFADDTLTSARGSPIDLVSPFHAELNAALRSSPSAVSPGSYLTLFPDPIDRTRLVTSLTLVERRGDVTIFRRLTRLSRDAIGRRHLLRGDHRGIVVDCLDAHYFMAFNRYGAREPTFCALRHLALGGGLLRGQAVLLIDELPTVLPVVMQPLPPETTLRQALGRIGSISVSSDAVDPVVRRLLRLAGP